MSISFAAMTRPCRHLALLCAAIALALTMLAPSSALAGTDPVISECANTGRLEHTYTLAQLRHARATLPSSVKEYTNCYDVISQAIVATLKTGTDTGGSGKSSGGSFLPTPVIIVLVVLILAAVTFGVIAVRRRQRGGPGAGGSGGPGTGGLAGPAGGSGVPGGSPPGADPGSEQASGAPTNP